MAAAATKESIITPPQNLEAEVAVLGSVIMDNRALAMAEAHLRPEDFYNTHHGIIFKAMTELRDDGQPIDAITLTKWLKAEDNLEKVGGGYYLTGLAAELHTATQVEHYAQIVAEAAQYRQLVVIGRDIADSAQAGAIAPSEILASVPATIGGAGLEYQHIGKAVAEVEGTVAAMLKEPGAIRGMRTGLRDLDNYTGGMQATDLIIIGARTSMGKTSLALQLAWEAGKTGVPSLVFTYESTAVELLERLVIKDAKIDGHKYQTGFITKEDGANIHASTKRLAALPIYLNDSSNQTIQSVMSSSRHLHQRNGVGLIIVDYLQRLETTKKRGETRATQLEEFCRKCKTLAKELQCRVVIVSQLSRNPESRQATKFRPIMSDLRESGGIEQEADHVWLLYRPSYYGIPTWPKDPNKTPTTNTAEIIVAKNRNGRRGSSIRVAFIEKHMLFADLAKQPELPN